MSCGAYGLSTTVADARFAKPLDTALIERLAREHEVLITIEEGSIGGFGSQVLHHLAGAGLLDHGLKVRPMVLPDRFIDHDSPAQQYDQAGLNARHIVQTALARPRPERKAEVGIAHDLPPPASAALLRPVAALRARRGWRGAGQSTRPPPSRRFYDTLLAVMKEGPKLGFAGRRDTLAPAIRRAFDLPLMTRLTVGPQWHVARPPISSSC